MLPKSKNGRFIGLVLGFVVLLAGTLLVLAQDTNTKLNLGNQTFSVMVADTPEEQQQGLSGTSQLNDNEGMLFTFDTDGYHGIWMKDMNYSIDILWLDSDKKVVTVANDVSPETYPEVFAPTAPARYIIELPAGTASKHSITDGTAARF